MSSSTTTTSDPVVSSTVISAVLSASVQVLSSTNSTRTASSGFSKLLVICISQAFRGVNICVIYGTSHASMTLYLPLTVLNIARPVQQIKLQSLPIVISSVIHALHVQCLFAQNRYQSRKAIQSILVCASVHVRARGFTFLLVKTYKRTEAGLLIFSMRASNVPPEGIDQ